MVDWTGGFPRDICFVRGIPCGLIPQFIFLPLPFYLGISIPSSPAFSVCVVALISGE